MRARNGLPRSSRLPDAASFSAVMRGGRQVHDDFFRVFAVPNREPCARLGIVVSRKVSRKAVARNRIKRRIREAFRHDQHTLASLDVVVIARPPAAQRSHAELGASLTEHWVKIAKKCKDC